MPSVRMCYALIGIVLWVPVALADEPQKSAMPSIDLKKPQADAPKKPLPESERKYWQCVLDHIRDTQSNEAIQLIQTACRALN